jgi:hypothetical protein
MAAVERIIELVFQCSNIPKMSLKQKLYLAHLFPTKLIIFVDISLVVVTEFGSYGSLFFKNFPVKFQQALY